MSPANKIVPLSKNIASGYVCIIAQWPTAWLERNLGSHPAFSLSRAQISHRRANGLQFPAARQSPVQYVGITYQSTLSRVYSGDQ